MPGAKTTKTPKAKKRPKAKPPEAATPKSHTVYFAGELFSQKHLLGNAYLAEAIYEKSHGKFLCILPQDLEPRGSHPHVIRDTDIHALLECDLGLFSFDGPELDSGTVVEFMLAKFADMPAVLLRTDFRAAGDQGKGDPWNLMCSFYPRTVSVSANSLALYKTASANRAKTAPRVKADPVLKLAGQHAAAAAQLATEQIATQVVRALNRAVATKPTLAAPLRNDVYTWLAAMPGFRGKPKDLQKTYAALLAAKTARGLL
ncbi:MAG: nucleoside 2-deoxyribosyltransferase [Verrucomicrobiota bacterium]